MQPQQPLNCLIWKSVELRAAVAALPTLHSCRGLAWPPIPLPVLPPVCPQEHPDQARRNRIYVAYLKTTLLDKGGGGGETRSYFRAEYARGRRPLTKRGRGEAGEDMAGLCWEGSAPMMKDWRSLHDARWSEDGGNAQGVCDRPATRGRGTRALPILFFRI